jgi:hypothetical protein
MRRNSFVKKTIQDFYPSIDPYFLEQLANESGNEYYLKAFSFVESVWDRDPNTLSEGQARWLSKINEDLEERLGRA